VVDLKRVPDRERSRLSAETKLLASLKNENILTFLGVWEANQQVCFVTEIVTSGTLKQYINRVFDKGIKLKIIQKWCRQIASGLDYLHSHEPPIIHRDIKCDNIFINGHSADICIGDLGLSTEKTRTHAESVLGTPEFMAPELYEERYTEKVDVYAFGMALLEMVTNEYPFAECSNSAQIYRKVMKGEGPAAIQRIETRSIKDFVELCLMPPERRLSSHDLLEHPFLALRNSDPRRENAQVVLTPKLDEEAVAATTSRKSIVDPGHGAEADSSKLRTRSHSKLTVQTPVTQESPAISSPTTVTSPPTLSPPLQTPPLNSGGQTVATPNPLLSSASSALSTPPVPAVSTPQPPPSQQSAPQPLPLYSQSPQPQAVATPATAQNPALTSQPTAPITVSTPSPSPAPPQLVDVVVASGAENKLNMRLRIRIQNANKDIKFPFDSNTDTAAQVATEMVQALNLAADQQASIASHIDEAIVKFRAAAASAAAASAAEAAASAVSAAAALPATVVPPAPGVSVPAAAMPAEVKPTYAAIAAAPISAIEPVVAAQPVAVPDAAPVANAGGSSVPAPSAPVSVVSSQQSQTSHQQATDKSSDHSSHKSSGKTETCAADTAKAVEEQLRLELQGRPITDLLRRFQVCTLFYFVS
jgi:serine/threonine protein kinase